ncbi:MAG: hypothetical protein WKF37_12260 [Bryobacteraceae bacterium]
MIHDLSGFDTTQWELKAANVTDKEFVVRRRQRVDLTLSGGPNSMSGRTFNYLKENAG